MSIEDMLYNEKARVEKEKRRALLEVLRNMAKHQQMQAAFFCSQNPKMPPEGERKKHPTFEFAKQMVLHLTECIHHRGGCFKVWNTNWGSYLGRKPAEGEAEQEFYLTACSKGK